jgi:hypothetical protein
MTSTWIESPKFIGVDLGDGKATGKVDVVFTSRTHAHVRTQGHVNDNVPEIMVRGKEWHVSLSVVPGPDGTWVVDNSRDTYQHISPKHSLSTRHEVPPTFRAAIYAAVSAAVTRVATPDVIALAEYASAAQQLSYLDRELTEARETLAALESQHAELTNTMRAYEAAAV